MFQRGCVHCRCVDKVFVGDSLCRFCKCKHEFTVIMIRKERVEQEGGQEDLTLDHKERKKERRNPQNFLLISNFKLQSFQMVC